MSDPGPGFDAIKKRLDDELAAGKTVVLGSADLDDPEVRLRLPQLLEQLAHTHQRESLSPLKLPGYTLLGEIGRGGMSAVHLARHEALSRTVAVKITPNWLASDPRSRERLVKEARSLALVSHPNIVRVYDVIDNDEAFAIAMEWVDGHTLARLLQALPATQGADDMVALKEKLGTPPQQAVALEASTTRTFVRMMRDIALAAQAVHDAGLLHLDIKPSNVLVRRDGTPLLADFGVVRELTNEQTHTHTFAGTPVYSAPEQLRRDDEHIGPHTDVYALGLTLYELLAREQPLRDLDLASIAKTVESGRFPPLSTFAEVPADLANIVQKAIAPEPGNRYPSAAALAADLTAFLEDRPVLARPLSRIQRLRRWTRSEPWKATLAAALLVLVPVLLGLGAYLAVQWPSLERIRAEERRVEANRLKNEALQNLLFSHADEPHNDGLLARAAQLDDGLTSLACRLLYANQTRSRDIGLLLGECFHRAPDNLALRLFKTVQDNDRLYFDDAEVEQLRRSDDPLDHYILAVDRVLLANDTPHPMAYQSARASIDQALLLNGPDELMHGLLVWSCYHLHEADRTAQAQRALERFWPRNVTALTWLASSQLDTRSPAAEQTLQQLEELAPRSVAAYSLRCRQLLLAQKWRRVIELERDARSSGVSAPILLPYALRAAYEVWAGPTAAAMAELLPRWAPSYSGVNAITGLEPRRAAQVVERMLTQSRPQSDIASMHAAANNQGHLPVLIRLQDYVLEHLPDRRMMDRELMLRLLQEVRQRQKTDPRSDIDALLARAAQIARRWRPNIDEDDFALVQMLILTTVGDWQALDAAARFWFEMSQGESRTLAACYIAFAESRLGNHVMAAEYSGIALSAKLSKATWEIGWLEAAWLHVAPDGPAALKDKDLAMYCMKRFQALNNERHKPQRGPWTNCVQAYVYGEHLEDEQNRGNALRLIDNALSVLDRGLLEPGAPDAKVVRERLEALEKRLR